MQATAEQPTTQRLSSKQIMPFVNSTIRVFTTMVKIKPEIVAPVLKEDAKTTYDVSGVIGFSGEIIGTVVLSFQMEAAQKLVSALVGMDIDPETPDFIDAVGELANMIAGSAKNDLGMKASIAVPTVIIGKNHMVGRLSGVPCVVIPCRTPVGDFAVEVNIKPAAV
ncbi:MAG: chemotaxis protein CheX [Tepidisphaeraceae bacterium]